MYCHFVSGIPFAPEKEREYISLVLREAKLYAEKYGKLSFDTFYIGGGTPSLLSPGALGRLWEGLERLFSFRLLESTIEVNPEDISPEKLKAWRDMGFTRVSLGLQAVQPEILSFLSRPVLPVSEVYEMTVHAGFARVSVDFIVGISGLDLQRLLRWIEHYLPDHLSLYLLSFEEGSTLAGLWKAGKIQPPEDDFQSSQYLELAESLSTWYEWYEISNFARGKENRALHNSLYWKHEPYIGLGIGASGWISWEKMRYQNTIHLSGYEEAVQRGEFPYGAKETLDEETSRREKIMLGLRTSDGVDVTEFSQREKAFLEEELKALHDFCRIRDGRLVLTPQGRMVAHTVILKIWDTLEKEKSHRAGLNR
ncbi:coproporphyrinogen-III oxidase family protein [Thermospira aquatica]|uniref:Coproporphyrinogen III oxidase family protein n=1 Tax=Thermospira aquatica TaxID=2828656 RepID=A0AAX3BFF5_9SPIR|nr:coproporphyrinogen III oxidase family protein [Thermospira aquatica]